MAEMKVIEVPIDDVKPYASNPRRNEKAVEAVANSIREFGFRNPIIVGRDMVIISGHTRRLAAIRLGLDRVPVVVADELTDEQALAFRLADNRVASFSRWDDEKLRKEIGEIAEIDLSAFGFKNEDIAEAIRDSEGPLHVCPKCGHEWG